MDLDALMKPPQPRTASPALARGSRTRLKSQATLILKREQPIKHRAAYESNTKAIASQMIIRKGRIERGKKKKVGGWVGDDLSKFCSEV